MKKLLKVLVVVEIVKVLVLVAGGYMFLSLKAHDSSLLARGAMFGTGTYSENNVQFVHDMTSGLSAIAHELSDIDYSLQGIARSIEYKN